MRSWTGRVHLLSDEPVCQGIDVPPPVKWRVIAVPANAILPDWLNEHHPYVRVMRKDNAAYEIAIEERDLERVPSKPANPDEVTDAEKDIYGFATAKARSHDRWLEHVESVIASSCFPGIKMAYWESNVGAGLKAQLCTRLLIRDISTSCPSIKLQLVHNLLFLFLNLEADHDSPTARRYLDYAPNELLEQFQDDLRDCHDDQTISIFRRLLEMSGGRTDHLLQNFDREYTAAQNSDLCAGLLGITRANHFGDKSFEIMRTALSSARIFAGADLTKADLVSWGTMIEKRLRIGVPQQLLSLPSMVLKNFSIDQLDALVVHLTRIYESVPEFDRQQSELPLLLTYYHQMKPSDRDVLAEWSRSEEGQRFYQRLLAQFRDTGSAEELALVTATLMFYTRLAADDVDPHDRPWTWSHLGDLDCLLTGKNCGNSRIVAEVTMHALIRTLRPLHDHYSEVCNFLEQLMDRESPPLKALDGLLYEYLSHRIPMPDRMKGGLSHEGAMGIMRMIFFKSSVNLWDAAHSRNSEKECTISQW